jgi:tRNA pseudouridine55 synthase
MHGVLVIDKPTGPTSHDVVAFVRRATGIRRIGHTGTLDPLASGVLPLVIGRASRLAQFLTSREKEYEARIRIGLATDTYDVTGQPVAAAGGGAPPDREAIAAALEAFRGPQRQQPPPFSAKKIGGQRAHVLARRGTPVLPAPAPVEVMALEILDAGPDWVSLRLVCSAGFYVRSLAHELGERLGTGACLEALRRRRSGEFGLDRAVALARLAADPSAAGAALVPIDALLSDLPGVILTGEGARRAVQGNLIGPAHLRTPAPAAATRVRLLDEQGRLVAIAAPADGPGFLHPGIVVG